MLSGTSYVLGPCLVQTKYHFNSRGVPDFGHEFKKSTPAEARDFALKLLSDVDYPDDIEISVLCTELRNGGGTERRPCAIYRRMAPEQTRGR